MVDFTLDIQVISIPPFLVTLFLIFNWYNVTSNLMISCAANPTYDKKLSDNLLFREAGGAKGKSEEEKQDGGSLALQHTYEDPAASKKVI